MKNTMPRVALALFALLALTASLAQAAEPKLPSPAYPQFKTAAALKSACDGGLKSAAGKLKALERRAVDAGWVAAYDDFYAFVEDTQNPIDFLQYVAPQKALRDAAQACSLRWADFLSGVNQNETLYKALSSAPTADAIDQELVRVAKGNFEDSGVALAPERRARAKQIVDRITELDQQFNKNIREAGVKVLFTEAELKGVPEGVWKKAKRTADSRIELGVDYPSYVPVLQSAESGAARERMWRAKTNEGGEANLKLLAEIAQLRHEYAGLQGFGNYVDFNLRRQMAKDGATALKFLADVKTAVASGEQTDLQDLRAAKAKQLGTPLEQTTVERWDANYYAELVRRERYSVDQNAFKAYFPPQQSLQFSLRLIEKLMGVKYTPVKTALWHPQAQAFVVSDAATGKPLGQLYVDLYPREGKYNHAAVWPLRSSSTRLARTSTAALVVNFDREGLTLDELETLLHELGHSVHNNLSQTRHVSQAGTTTMRDFVEAPSQMLEDWVYDKQVLKLMQEVCPSCKPVPEAMLAQAVAAKKFGKATQFGRQHLYASYDLALHGADQPDPMQLWAKLEGATLLGHQPGTMFPAGFAHLSGGYGAGYYGYLWSLVVAMDLRTPFKADKLDATVGARYRSLVLSQGSQKPAPALVRDFLGRESNAKAFFDDLADR